MNWTEIRASSYGTLLPGDMNDENGWPTPDRPEFWEGISDPDDILPFICNQARRYCEADNTGFKIFATCFSWERDKNPGLPTDDTINAILQVPKATEDDSISSYFKRGAVMSWLLDQLGLDRRSFSESIKKMLADDPEIQSKINEFTPLLKAFLWWSFFTAEGMSSIIGERRLRLQILQQRGLDPPNLL